GSVLPSQHLLHHPCWPFLGMPQRSARFFLQCRRRWRRESEQVFLCAGRRGNRSACGLPSRLGVTSTVTLPPVSTRLQCRFRPMPTQNPAENTWFSAGLHVVTIGGLRAEVPQTGQTHLPGPLRKGRRLSRRLGPRSRTVLTTRTASFSGTACWRQCPVWRR